MQFLQAVNWLRTSLPRLAEVVELLRVLLEEHMRVIQRQTKRVASNRTIVEEAWKREQVAAWSNVQDLVANAVTLSHPKNGCEVLMFPDASDNHWGSFFAQVPTAELEGVVEVEKVSHEPIGILSGTFRGSQKRWTTVDKEGFAIVSTFRRLEYLLWGGVRVYIDHRSLAYIFELEARVSSVPKTGAQRLENWKMMLAQYDYTIMHIYGESKCWRDLLSRWVNVPVVAVRAVAVFANSAPDEIMPSKNAIREVQQQARAGLSAMVIGISSFTSPVGRETKDNEDLFRPGLNSRDVLWILEQAKDIQTRLMVCAHMKDAGHWGVVTALQRLQGYCC